MTKMILIIIHSIVFFVKDNKIPPRNHLKAAECGHF